MRKRRIKRKNQQAKTKPQPTRTCHPKNPCTIYCLAMCGRMQERKGKLSVNSTKFAVNLGFFLKYKNKELYFYNYSAFSYFLNQNILRLIFLNDFARHIISCTNISLPWLIRRASFRCWKQFHQSCFYTTAEYE